MKHLLALLAALVLGGIAAAIVASVAFPHVNGFSYAPPILVFPFLSPWVSLSAYVISMFAASLWAKEPSKKKHPAWGVAVATSATFVAAMAFAGLIRFRESQARIAGERHRVEKQELQRRDPHALVDDIDLPDDEDSGYRIRFVDDEGVVRASSDPTSVVSYVILPPGKHRLVLHADTPKGARLKLEWFLQEEVEVEAGHFYKLRVANGRIALVEVKRFQAPNQAREPTAPSGRGSP